jgi:hypothetical protein
MKLNQVTWYSSLLAIVLFVVFVVGAFLAGRELGYALGYADGSEQDASAPSESPIEESPSPALPPNDGSAAGPDGGRVVSDKDEWLSLTALYQGNNAWTYVLKGTKPTPCHEVAVSSVVRESFPEQVGVQYRFVSPPADTACIQVIAEVDVSGEFSAGDQAVISLEDLTL